MAHNEIALTRVASTVVGVALLGLSLASMYLLWPRDKAEEDAPPAGDLEAAA